MAKTINITWDLPTERASGKPLDPSELIGVEVSLNAGAGFALATTVPADETQAWVFPDMVDGDYTIRLVVKGTTGDSAPVDTDVEVDTSAPGTVQNVQVSLT